MEGEEQGMRKQSKLLDRMREIMLQISIADVTRSTFNKIMKQDLTLRSRTKSKY